MRMIVSRYARADAGAPTGPPTRRTVPDKIPARNEQKLADTYRDNFRFNMARYGSMITQSTETGGFMIDFWPWIFKLVSALLEVPVGVNVPVSPSFY